MFRSVKCTVNYYLMGDHGKNVVFVFCNYTRETQGFSLAETADAQGVRLSRPESRIPTKDAILPSFPMRGKEFLTVLMLSLWVVCCLSRPGGKFVSGVFDDGIEMAGRRWWWLGKWSSWCCEQ